MTYSFGVVNRKIVIVYIKSRWQKVATCLEEGLVSWASSQGEGLVELFTVNNF